MINESPYVALLGNPNSGKTAIFNRLTGLNLKVSNYPGITVEKRIGVAHLSSEKSMNIMDLPGTYSLLPESMDEQIVTQQIFNWMSGDNCPHAIVSVVDSTNLSRNLFLTSQLLDLGIPIIIALNMMDRPQLQEKNIDVNRLKKIFGVEAVIPMSARENWGFSELKKSIIAIENINDNKNPIKLNIPKIINEKILPIVDFLHTSCSYNKNQVIGQTLRIITKESTIDIFCDANILNQEEGSKLKELRNQVVMEIEKHGMDHEILEATLRYDMLDRLLSESNIIINDEVKKKSHSEKIDRVLTHDWLGPIIFVSLLYIIFQSIFTFATIPMDWIDSGVGFIGNFIIYTLPSSVFRNLLVEGIISGVGSILIFLPQIIILMFFLNILENTGYMARVAFMMDRFMRTIGLNGKSVLPLMSGYACAIPGIMATRTIDNWKERLITILILPLMSCSARLPVYTLMISAFIPNTIVFGIFGLQGITMVVMYFLGTITAMFIALFISRFIDDAGSNSFIMELPPYRIPLARSVFYQLYVRAKLFILNAGRIIMAISIILWFLASFPNQDSKGNSVNINESYVGKIGHAIEPLIEPLGFDWKIGVGLITSFAAREVVVSTLATLYNVEDTQDGMIGISEALQSDMNPLTGKPRYTPLVALSIMVFFVYAAQCMATFAIVKSETNSWKWPVAMIIYMTMLAYLGSLLVYQGGQLLGFS